MYDVIVVGAGPAGSTAARYTAMSGLRTMLIEKEKFPRIKPCAGGVSRYALENLGIELPSSLIERRIKGARVWYKTSYMESMNDQEVAVTVLRDRFDEFLADQAIRAGANFLDNTPVTGVDIDRDCATVHTEQGSYCAKMIIGADGMNGVCARNVRSPYDKKEVAFSMEAEIPVNDYFLDDNLSNMVQFHFGDVPRGYGWVFPKKDRICVGIGEIGPNWNKPMNSYRLFFKKLGIDYVKPRGYMLPVGGHIRNTYNDRILLTGDSAGFVDAFLGEGIAYAIISGKLAAETAADAHESNNYSSYSLSAYQRKCQREFGSDLKYSLLLSRIFYRNPDLFASMLIRHPSLLDRFVLLATPDFNYASYLKWLIPRLPLYVAKELISLKI